MINLKEILSITGKPGLFRIVTTSKTNIIVQSMIDGKRTAVSANSKISALDDISIFTYEDDVPLAEVMQAIYDKTNGQEGPSPKAAHAELRSFLEEILPNFDQDRVYHSDLKKLFSWYNQLLAHGLFTAAAEEATSEVSSENEESKEG